MLPGGVDEYLRRRKAGGFPSGVAAVPLPTVPTTPFVESAPPTPKAKAGSADERAARKTVSRIDKQLERIAKQEAELNQRMAAAAADYEELARVVEELRALAAEKETLELEWLEAATLLE